MKKLFVCQFIESRPLLLILLFSIAAFLVSCNNIPYDLEVTTVIEQDSQVTNQWILTVPATHYHPAMFYDIKKRATEAGYLIKDYSVSDERGVIATENYKSFEEFLTIYGHPSTETAPRLFQFGVGTTRISNLIEKYLVELRIDTRFFKPWGDVHFRYALFMPGKVMRHNGILLESNHISWDLNRPDTSDYYLYAQSQVVHNSPVLWFLTVLLSIILTSNIIQVGNIGVSSAQKTGVIPAVLGFMLIFFAASGLVYTGYKLADISKEITVWQPVMVGSLIVVIALLQYQGIMPRFFHFRDNILARISGLTSRWRAYLPKLEKPRFLRQLQTVWTSNFSEDVSILLERLSVSPLDTDSRLELARLYVRYGLYKQAIAMYQEDLLLRPEDHEARIELLHCYYALGMRDESSIEIQILLETEKFSRDIQAISRELDKFRERLKNP